MQTSFFARRGGDAGTQKPATNARVGHVYLDTQRRTLYCLNETARELVREGVPFSREDLKRQPLRTLGGDAVGPDDLPLFRAWRAGTPCESVFQMARTGAACLVSWTASPVQDTAGGVLGVVGTVTVAPPEPDWSTLAGLAHDLRTPLQALRLLIPVLESMPLLSTESAEALDRLRSSADRALSIGMDLLEWCRAPTDPGRRVERDWFALGPFLTSLAAEQTPAAQRKGIALHLDLGAALPLEVHTDRVRLGRLLANLLSNAVRYTTAGQVRFTAGWRHDAAGHREALVLAVADTGAGISPEDQESIFQPFERGRSGKEGDSGGSGVGLAVVDRLVKELNLTLEVFSEYGHGSTFELLLPPGALRPAVR